MHIGNRVMGNIVVVFAIVLLFGLLPSSESKTAFHWLAVIAYHAVLVWTFFAVRRDPNERTGYKMIIFAVGFLLWMSVFVHELDVEHGEETWFIVPLFVIAVLAFLEGVRDHCRELDRCLDETGEVRNKSEYQYQQSRISLAEIKAEASKAKARDKAAKASHKNQNKS